MASVIKKFFQKKKLDVKFKKAGEGYKLTDNQPSGPSYPQYRSSPQASATPRRQHATDGAKKAGAAALSRIEANQPKGMVCNSCI